MGDTSKSITDISDVDVQQADCQITIDIYTKCDRCYSGLTLLPYLVSIWRGGVARIRDCRRCLATVA